MLQKIKINYYDGSYVHLFADNKRYYKIIVDTKVALNSRIFHKYKAKMKCNLVQIFKQDLRGKLFSSYKFIKDFNTYKEAKKYLKELVN